MQHLGTHRSRRNEKSASGSIQQHDVVSVCQVAVQSLTILNFKIQNSC